MGKLKNANEGSWVPKNRQATCEGEILLGMKKQVCSSEHSADKSFTC